ncbi:hypothetical protein ACEPAH_1032 [Sanghuangporus vaninii]
MLFSRVVSFFAFSMALGGLSVASPAAEQPNLGAVQSVVTNLRSTTDTIVPELRNMVANNNVTEAAVVPLMNQLISAINNARNSVATIPRSVPASIQKRQNESDIAAAVAAIIEDITSLLDSLLGSAAAVPILGVLIPELDAALTTLVVGLSAVVTGLTTAVACPPSLVSSVASDWDFWVPSLAWQVCEAVLPRLCSS